MSKPKPRRWFRFSLRTLLVLTALVCIALGWKMNQVQRQRRAVEAIRVHDGSITYDYQYEANYSWPTDAPPGPEWFRKLAGDDFFAHPIKVGIYEEYNVDDKFIEASVLADLPYLKSLHLVSTRVTDLTPLAELTHLEELILSKTPVQDLSPLSNLRSLRALDVSSTQVENLSPLEKLPNLSILAISDTTIGDEEVEELQRALPDLKIIR